MVGRAASPLGSLRPDAAAASRLAHIESLGGRPSSIQGRDGVKHDDEIILRRRLRSTLAVET